MRKQIFSAKLFFAIILTASCAVAVCGQQTSSEILAGEDLLRIVPTGFYFAGQSAQTQMRNAAAAKLAENRHIVAGLVDTSGYSTEISGKYEGFFITDSAVKIAGKMLGTGAYGFGFSQAGKVNFFDLSGKEILSVPTVNAEMKRPRPLMMANEKNGVRLYKGKSYVLISIK